MRFGIMAMQIDALVPPAARGLPPQEMLASVLGFSHAGLVRELFAAGFNPVELGGDLGMLLPPAFSPAAIDELAALKDELGVSYTVHLPLWSVEPSTLLEPVRQGSVQALVEMVHLTQSLQPEVYVLHATGALAAEFYRMRLPEVVRAALLSQFQGRARQSIQAILQQTGLPPRKLAIETVEFPFDLTLELAEALDLSVCLDTGHVLVGFSGPIGLFDALECCLPRLAEVHLHDGPWQGPEMRIGYGKDHQPLGSGDLQVGRFLARLKEAGFDGPLIFELNLPQALDSLNTIRRISEGYG